MRPIISPRSIYYRLREKSLIWIAWHLPWDLVYWCTIRIGAHATQGEWGHECPSNLLYFTALARWEQKDNSPIELASPIGAPWAPDHEGNISPFPELSEHYSFEQEDPTPASAEHEASAGSNSATAGSLLPLPSPLEVNRD